MKKQFVRCVLTACAIPSLFAVPSAAQDLTLPSPSAPAPQPAPTDPIARLGDRMITYGNFQEWLRVMNKPQFKLICESPTARKLAMKQYFYTLILSTAGRRSRVQETKAFKETLALMEQEAYARVMMDETLPGSVAQGIKLRAEHLTDDQFRAYFATHHDQFDQPARYTMRHIQVNFKGPGDAGLDLTEGMVLEKIAGIQDQLRKGRSFAELAAAHSDDLKSRSQGGQYQDLAYGHLSREVEEAVRTQPLGVVGEPVKDYQGYHLILVEARKPAEAAVLDAKVKDIIRKRLVPERQAQMTKDYLDQTTQRIGFRELTDPARP